MGRAIPTGLENSLFRPECVITETMGRGVGKEQERGGGKEESGTFAASHL